jgi:hypothetical protein
MDPKKHLDQFLTICDIHLIEHDDVMVILFLQTLIGPTYDWYLSLPENTISSFDDMEDVFMYKFVPPIAYHTLLTQFTQIHLQKNERIKDFNVDFSRLCTKFQRNNIQIIQSSLDAIKMKCHQMSIMK